MYFYSWFLIFVCTKKYFHNFSILLAKIIVVISPEIYRFFELGLDEEPNRFLKASNFLRGKNITSNIVNYLNEKWNNWLS